MTPHALFTRGHLSAGRPVTRCSRGPPPADGSPAPCRTRARTCRCAPSRSGSRPCNPRSFGRTGCRSAVPGRTTSSRSSCGCPPASPCAGPRGSPAHVPLALALLDLLLDRAHASGGVQGEPVGAAERGLLLAALVEVLHAAAQRAPPRAAQPA